MSEMRSALLLTLEFPPQVGGVASYLSGFVQALRGAGRAVTVLAPPLGRGLFPWRRLILPAWHAVRKEKPSVLIISHALPVGYIALLMRTFARLPYVVIVHGLDVLLPQRNPWKRFWLKMVLMGARGIIANSEFTKKEVVRFRLAEKTVMVVYPCVNEKLVTIGADAVFAAPSGKKILLTIGRLVARKGHDTVIRALPAIAAQVPEILYIVGGDGPERERLTRLARELGIAERVLFLGAVPEINIPALYAAADIFVMPTRQIGADVEGFGLVFLEANAFGKPVVGGRSGGVPEAIVDGETGLLVPPDDPQALAEAVIRIFKNPDLMARLGERGRERVREEFRWEVQIEKVLSRLANSASRFR